MPVVGGSHKPDLLCYCQYGEAEYEMAGSPGGTTVTFQSVFAGNLNIGDAVYLASQNATAYSSPNAAGGSTTPGYGSLTSPTLWFAPQVSKSTTAANYAGTGTGCRAGIVVGGDAIYKNVQSAPNIVSQPTPAAVAAGQLVYVMTDGICWAFCDNAAAAVGGYLIASVITAGYVHYVTSTTAGSMIGIVLNTTGAAGAVLMQVNLF
jgi:hypothetical protein